jgi:hypothetical protein
VCFGPECAKIVYRKGEIVDVVISKQCPVQLRDKAKQAAQELLDGKVKMRYTVEE